MQLVSATELIFRYLRLEAEMGSICPIVADAQKFDPKDTEALGVIGFTPDQLAGRGAFRNKATGFIALSVDDLKQKPYGTGGQPALDVLMRLWFEIYEPPGYSGTIYQRRQQQIQESLYGVILRDSQATEPWKVEYQANHSPTPSGRQSSNDKFWEIYGYSFFLVRTEYPQQRGLEEL